MRISQSSFHNDFKTFWMICFLSSAQTNTGLYRAIFKRFSRLWIKMNLSFFKKSFRFCLAVSLSFKLKTGDFSGYTCSTTSFDKLSCSLNIYAGSNHLLIPSVYCIVKIPCNFTKKKARTSF